MPVLGAGCGNSAVGERMVTDPALPSDVTVLNIDNCEFIIEKMRNRQQRGSLRSTSSPSATSTSSAASVSAASGGGKKRNRIGRKERASDGNNDDVQLHSSTRESCQYEVMSVERLELEDNSFDMCLDKGCLGTVLGHVRVVHL